MSTDIRTVEIIDGSQQNRSDRLGVALQLQVANAVGSGAGAAVTVAIAFPATANLPANYGVFIDPGQDAVWYVSQSSKTATGFTVTLNPRLAANTLAAGAIDILVVA